MAVVNYRGVLELGIGPWRLTDDRSELRRLADDPSGVHGTDWPAQAGAWSRSHDRIAVRPQKAVRITLIGESVARGFLLDPTTNLAVLSEHAISAANCQDKVEVVDLTANNLTPAQAVRLCYAAAELGTSVVVVYVGNNFVRATPWLTRAQNQTAVARRFRRDGYAGYLHLRSQAMASVARTFRSELARFVEVSGTPVVLVIPAVNLVDWRSRWIAPGWIDATAGRQWVSVQRELVSRMNGLTGDGGEEAASDATCLELARRLVDLDGGTTPRPLELVGRGLATTGTIDEAKSFLQLALAVAADPWHGERRCVPEVYEELRRLGAMPGVTVVDVPTRLEAALGAEALGRGAFLDYCHHTPEALGVVAAAIMDEALAITSVGGVPAPRQSWRAPSGLADAYLLSALHNHHWGQSPAVTTHWILKAAAEDSATIARLDDYFVASADTAPFWLSARLAKDSRQRLQWYLRNYSHLRVLDAGFTRLLESVAVSRSDDVTTGLRNAWRNRGAEVGAGVDLLDPFWRERDGPAPSGGVFRGERSLTAAYGFVSDGSTVLRLRMVIAAGPGLAAVPFEVIVNGGPAYHGHATARKRVTGVRRRGPSGLAGRRSGRCW